MISDKTARSALEALTESTFEKVLQVAKSNKRMSIRAAVQKYAGDQREARALRRTGAVLRDLGAMVRQRIGRRQSPKQVSKQTASIKRALRKSRRTLPRSGRKTSRQSHRAAKSKKKTRQKSRVRVRSR